MRRACISEATLKALGFVKVDASKIPLTPKCDTVQPRTTFSMSVPKLVEVKVGKQDE